MTLTDIEPVAVPSRLLDRLGDRDPGTRMYRRLGRKVAFAEWFDAVCRVSGPEGVLSAGSAAMYVQVSRAGLHKRMKEGRLTAFLFHVDSAADAQQCSDDSRQGGRPYCFIPVRECRAWAEARRSRGRARTVREPVVVEKPSQPTQRSQDAWKQW